MKISEDDLKLFNSSLNVERSKELLKILTSYTYYSQKYKAIYYEIPKCACSTLKFIIAYIENNKIEFYNNNNIAQFYESTLKMGIHYREINGLKSLANLNLKECEFILKSEDFFHFTFVRNPYSRIFSAWADKIRQDEPGYQVILKNIRLTFGLEKKEIISFDAFVKWISLKENVKTCNHHWRSMSSILIFDIFKSLKIYKLENFNNDIENFLTQLKINVNKDFILSAFKFNESIPVLDWKDYYNEETAKIVYALYNEDFNNFNYSVDSWKKDKLDYSVSDLLDYIRNLERASVSAIRDRNEMIYSIRNNFNLELK